MKLGLLVIEGFRQSSYRVPSGGMFELLDKLRDRYDSRKDAWIEIRTWDSDQLAHDAAEMIRCGCDQLALLPFSWGWRGAQTVTAGAAVLGRAVDIICVDPVPANLLDAVDPRLDSPLTLAPNIERAAVIRTLNWKIGQPVGHDLAGDRVVNRTIIGSADNVARWQPAGVVDQVIDDGSVVHFDVSDQPPFHAIDNDCRVHDWAMDMVERFKAAA